MGEFDLVNVLEFWLWGARSVMFYKGLRLWEGSGSDEAVSPGGSAKEIPSRAWGEEDGGDGELGSCEFK